MWNLLDTISSPSHYIDAYRTNRKITNGIHSWFRSIWFSLFWTSYTITNTFENNNDKDLDPSQIELDTEHFKTNLTTRFHFIARQWRRNANEDTDKKTRINVCDTENANIGQTADVVSKQNQTGNEVRIKL